jgi:hypothetical protein
MNIKVVLIVFKYKKNILHGSLIDLYLTYHHALKITDENLIDIITDIDDISFESLRNSITEKIINPQDYEMENFLKKLSNVKTKNDILLNDSNIYDKIVIYFSGHCENGNLLLPNQDEYSFSKFKSDVLKISSPDAKIFCILDCCEPPDFNLQYKFEDNIFVLNSKYDYISQTFLLITSSDENQKSNMKMSGSIFTKYLFQLLSKREFKKIKKEVNDKIRNENHDLEQHMNIYCSKNIFPILWNWLLFKQNYEIIFEYSNIIIKRI